MNSQISKLLVVIALLLSSQMVRAQNEGFEEVTVLARIHSVKDVEALSGYAVKLEEEGLSKILTELRPEDEVILKGSIKYNPVTMDSKTEMRPTFYIEKIIPVSLKRIGESEFKVADPKLNFALKESAEPKTLPVSGKVATAITLTASVLLMQNLTHGAGDSNPQEQLQSQIFFGAGALATGLYIWEQIQKGSLK